MPGFVIEAGRGRKHTEVCLTNTKQIEDEIEGYLRLYYNAIRMQCQ